MTPLELNNFAEQVRSGIRTDYTTLYYFTQKVLAEVKNPLTSAGLAWSLARMQEDVENIEESLDRYLSYLKELNAGNQANTKNT